MSVVTFYSYKGGVGRSLAVANVAVLLAQMNTKVLVIDWDLEAPGLEEYFENFHVRPEGLGLLYLLRNKGSYKKHIWNFTSTIDNVKFDLIPSGRDEESYYSELEKFSWADFFNNNGGQFLEDTRKQWLEDYDFILIDSRTGLSDSGGICTIQLPDIVVGMFTATKQSVRGVHEVLSLAQKARKNIAYDRPQISIIPVPCRMNSDNLQIKDMWLDEFSSTLKTITNDWRPRNLEIKEVLSKLEVPHTPKLTHGTHIIVESNSKGDTQKAFISLNHLAKLIKSDLSDLSMFRLEKLIKRERTTPKTQQDKNFDIFISVASGSGESKWVEEIFLPALQIEFKKVFNKELIVFFDKRELSIGSSFSKEVSAALMNSRIFMPILNERYFRSNTTETHFISFNDNRENRRNYRSLDLLFEEPSRGVLVPISVGDFETTQEVLSLWDRSNLTAEYLDFSPFLIRGDLNDLNQSSLSNSFFSQISTLIKSFEKYF